MVVCCTHREELDASLSHELGLLGDVLEVEGVVEQVLLQGHEDHAQLDRTLAQTTQLRVDHSAQDMCGREGGQSVR